MAKLTLKDFIDAGWHTIPFTKPTITRDAKGKKHFTAIFDWQRLPQPNKLDAEVGATLVGKKAGVVVIDCDSTNSTILIEKLNPYKNNVAYSVGKRDSKGNKIRGASFFFAWSADIPPTFNNGNMQLELFNDGQHRMVFLPTQGNETKKPWSKVPILKPMPPELIELMKMWYRVEQLEKTNKDGILKVDSKTENLTPFKIYPLVNKALLTPKLLDKTLFKVLTPKSFRDNEYELHGYKHPKNIPNGQGSSYLSKISAILGSDISIDKLAYKQAMKYVLSHMGKARKQKHKKSIKIEILDPMLKGRAKIGNKPIWRYDKNWDSNNLTLISKLGHLIEFFYDPTTHFIVEINHTINTIKHYDNASKVAPYISNISSTYTLPSTAPKLLAILPNYREVMTPVKEFGKLSETEFNTFKPTEPLKVINNPKLWETRYIKPNAFIEYMESLVPYQEDRDYLLSHLFTKLTSFEYSPVVYYFVGKSGSGKGLFVKLIEEIISKSYMSVELGADEIVGKYNSWLDKKYFVHFDELYESVGNKDLTKVKGNIKRYTGSETFSCRGMNSNHYDAKMLATFIFTSNGTDLSFDVDDRRFFYLYTPKKLDPQIATVLFKKNNREAMLCDIAYYIATNYPKLNKEDYTTPLYTDRKEQLIVEALPHIRKLMYFLKNKKWKELYDIAVDAEVEEEFLSIQHRGKIPTYVIQTMYNYLSGKEVDNLKLVRDYIKKELTGQPRHSYTTIKGTNTHCITVPTFLDFIAPLEEI